MIDESKPTIDSVSPSGPAGGQRPDQKPKALSPSDPSSAWTTRGRHKVQFGYSVNYLLDLQDGVIVDVEATPTRISKERDAAEAMIERTNDRLGLKPGRLAADMAYGTGELLGWLVNEQGIDPHIPVWEKAKREDGTLSREDFAFDKDRDVYTCPGGKTLKTCPYQLLDSAISMMQAAQYALRLNDAVVLIRSV